MCFERLCAEPVVHCGFGCGRAVHEDCFRRYAAAAHGPARCVLCRAAWDPPKTSGGGRRGYLVGRRLVDLSETVPEAFLDPVVVPRPRARGTGAKSSAKGSGRAARGKAKGSARGGASASASASAKRGRSRAGAAGSSAVEEGRVGKRKGAGSTAKGSGSGKGPKRERVRRRSTKVEAKVEAKQEAKVEVKTEPTGEAGPWLGGIMTRSAARRAGGASNQR